jgi:hypothetical protein
MYHSHFNNTTPPQINTCAWQHQGSQHVAYSVTEAHKHSTVSVMRALLLSVNSAWPLQCIAAMTSYMRVCMHQCAAYLKHR